MINKLSNKIKIYNKELEEIKQEELYYIDKKIDIPITILMNEVNINFKKCFCNIYLELFKSIYDLRIKLSKINRVKVKLMRKIRKGRR